MRPPSQAPDQTYLRFNSSHWANFQTVQQTTSDSNFIEDPPSGPSLDYKLPARGHSETRTEMETIHFPGHPVKQCPTTNMSRQSIDSACYPSPHSSPWLSSSSISDGCSYTWPSPAASTHHSPEPHPREHVLSYAALPGENMSVAFQPFTSLSQVQHHPDAAPDYLPPAAMIPPYYQSSWHHHRQPEQMQAIFAVEGCWQAASNSCSLPSSTHDPSPAPCPAPESKIQPRRREQKVALRQEIKKEPTESSQMDSSMGIQQSHETSSKQTSSPAPQPSKIKPGGDFPCPLVMYGCKSSFLSKNESKRHMTSRHLCLEIWRCDQCVGYPNDFNRKDLFYQHLRRMHFRLPKPAAPKTTKKSSSNSSNLGVQESLKILPTEAAHRAAEGRCHIKLRDPPTHSGCPFCDKTFVGQDSWAEHVEHVNKHFSMFKKEGLPIPDPRTWNRDTALEKWLLRENILVVKGNRLQLQTAR